MRPRARNIDIVLADTAGRLPTQLHLMEEIAKVKRVIAKADPTGPHEVLLVLDGNIGQNALAQVKAFDAALGVTGLIMTKLDGTARGGVIAAIAKQQRRAPSRCATSASARAGRSAALPRDANSSTHCSNPRSRHDPFHR
jgi:fused signal recognition particle receptor